MRRPLLGCSLCGSDCRRDSSVPVAPSSRGPNTRCWLVSFRPRNPAYDLADPRSSPGHAAPSRHRVGWAGTPADVDSCGFHACSVDSDSRLSPWTCPSTDRYVVPESSLRQKADANLMKYPQDITKYHFRLKSSTSQKIWNSENIL